MAQVGDNVEDQLEQFMVAASVLSDDRLHAIESPGREGDILKTNTVRVEFGQEFKTQVIKSRIQVLRVRLVAQNVFVDPPYRFGMALGDVEVLDSRRKCIFGQA
jgi:16S rRNA G966 N2-methylase RsmD